MNTLWRNKTLVVRGLLWALLTALPYNIVFSTPESFDHLAAYKRNQTKTKGPVREIVENIKTNSSIYAKYVYNNNNQLIKEEYFNQEGNLEGYLIHHYQKNGINKSILYDASNKKRESISFRTSGSGKVLSYSVFNENEQKTVSWKFDYDSDGRIISGSRISKKKRTESFQRDYRRNQIYQVIINQNGEKAGVIVSYLRDGKVFQRLKDDNTGKRKIEYSYDSQGRFTEMKFFVREQNKYQLTKIHRFEYDN